MRSKLTEHKEFYLLINSLRLGGAEKNCVNLANAFVEKGIKVTLVVLELRDAVLKDKLSPEVNLVSLETAHARESIFKLRKLILENNIKQFLVFTFQLAVVLVLIRKIWKAEFTIVARSINSLTEKYKHEKSLWHKWISQLMVKRWFFEVDHIIAQSTGMKKELLVLMGKKQTPVTVIFNFLEVGPEKILIDQKSDREERKLLFVGKLKPQKNLFFLIDAFALALEKKQGMTLKIVGDGELKAELQDYIKSKGLQHSIILSGKSENVSEYYLEANLLVLTSHYEGFPNVLVEAHSFGIPVVSMDCPSGPSDIVIQNENGLLVKDKNPKIFGEAIIQALELGWEKEKIKASVDRFSKQKAVEEYLEVMSKY
ncbi:MAG: glycosyltransferase [Mongoliibacter sp.]|nr:MAG: glycosyltransferase [Mongoliibacter sp.]